MPARDIDIVAKLLARIGGSWHPERPRPAHNGVSSRHRDVARLILAELHRADAAREAALRAAEPLPSSDDGTSDAPEGNPIQVGTMVAYRPPGDVRTITCRVEQIEGSRAYLVPVHPEIGWISTNTLQNLAPPARPKPFPGPTGQAVPHQDSGAAPGLASAGVQGRADHQPPAQEAGQSGAPSDSSPASPTQKAPARPGASSASQPGGKPVAQGQAPQPSPSQPGAPSAPESASAVVAPTISPKKAAAESKKSTKVQYYFNSAGDWVAFRYRNDRYLFNTKGKWIGTFPWKDNEIVDVHGKYLGTVLDKNRIYQKMSSPPSTRKAGFIPSPGDAGYVGYAERAAFCDPPYGFQDIDWKTVQVGERNRLKNSIHVPPPETSSLLHRILSAIGLAGLANWIERATDGR